jgi:pSer/pThr/pTyr-binding forkhead associated (FHA) protein
MNDYTGATLITKRGPGSSEPIPLDRSPMIIGREPGSDIEVSACQISRRHAEITRVDGIYHIRDLGSANGTIVDTTRIDDSPMPLRQGSVITLGNGYAIFELFLGQTRVQPWIRVDPSLGDLWVDGRLVELSKTQFALVIALDAQHGGWVSKDSLIGQLWPEGGTDDQLTTLAHRVRQRIDPDSRRNPIINDRRRGYRLNG